MLKGGIIAVILWSSIFYLLISLKAHGDTFLTNTDGTVFPAPAWGDLLSNQSLVGTNCFTIQDYQQTNLACWDVSSSNFFAPDGSQFCVETILICTNLITGQGNVVCFSYSTNYHDWVYPAEIEVKKWYSFDQWGNPFNCLRVICLDEHPIAADYTDANEYIPDNSLDSTVRCLTPECCPEGVSFAWKIVTPPAQKGGYVVQSFDSGALQGSQAPDGQGTLYTNGVTGYELLPSPTPYVGLLGLFVIFVAVVVGTVVISCRHYEQVATHPVVANPPPPPPAPGTNGLSGYTGPDGPPDWMTNYTTTD